MSTTTFVSVSEYLATHYRPDQEYIDGQLRERNAGELDHSWMQGEILLHFAQYRQTLGFLAFPEWRVQVKPTRFRVPDITVVRGRPGEQILMCPPFLCIENTFAGRRRPASRPGRASPNATMWPSA